MIATKTFNPMAEGADHGLGAARIRRQVETSLRRLGVERIPLYLAHDFDPDVPQEETLGAFDELVRHGTVGAVGASNFTAEQLAEALELSALEGLTRYEWVQNGFSLLEQGDRGDRLPALPRARPRLHAVQPARRRVADRQVPSRRAAARRIAHDRAPGGQRGVLGRRDVRRARGVRAGGRRARRLDGRARDRMAPPCSGDHRRRRRAEHSPSNSPRSGEALDVGSPRTSATALHGRCSGEPRGGGRAR